MSFAAGSPKTDDANARASKRLADFMYLTAVEQMSAMSNATAAAKLQSRAYELNPSDPTLAFAQGSLWSMYGDSAQLAKAPDMIAAIYYANPGNLEAGMDAYSMLASQKAGTAADRLRLVKKLRDNFPDNNKVFLMLLDEYMQAVSPNNSEALDSVRSMLNSKISRDPEEPYYYIQLVNSYNRAQKQDSVLSALNLITESFPREASLLVTVARTYMQLGDTIKAYSTLDKAELADSTNGDLWLARADIFKAKGDSAAYGEQIAKALRSTTLDVEAKGQLLYSYLSDGSFGTDPDDIEDLILHLIEETPTEPQFHYLYAMWLENKKRYVEASEQMISVYDNEDEDDIRSLYTAGMLLNYGNEPQKAADLARKYLKKFPEETSLLSLLISSLLRAEKNSEALQELDKANLDSLPDPVVRSNFFLMQGDLYFQLDSLDQGIAAYDKALKANPNNIMALNNYAYFLAKGGRDLPKAAEMSYKAITAEPENPTYLDTYAWVLFKQLKYVEAKEYIDKTLAIYEKPEPGSEAKAKTGSPLEETEQISADVYDHAGDIYFMNQMHKEAVEFWQQALKLEPDNKLIAKKVKLKTYFPE